MTTAATAPARKSAGLIRSVLVTAAATGGLTALGFALRPETGTDWQTPAWALWLHIGTVVPALPLGAWVLMSRKGTGAHRIAGRVWALMMLVTSIASFWIRDLTGGIGPIHLFSVLTLVSIPMAIWHARRGNIAAHRQAMVGVYIGLVVAGLFALMPGRFLLSTILG